jgi:hypothetical protein
MPPMSPLYSVTLPAPVKCSQAREAMTLILNPGRLGGTGASVIGTRRIESSLVEVRITVPDGSRTKRLEELLESARRAGKVQSWHTLKETAMYVDPNFPSKKAFKEALAAGKSMYLFQPGLGTVPENGTVSVEGPHYPKPHTWYASVTIVNGKITKIV